MQMQEDLSLFQKIATKLLQKEKENGEKNKTHQKSNVLLLVFSCVARHASEKSAEENGASGEESGLGQNCPTEKDHENA